MSEVAIQIDRISKAYRIWRDPSARLKAPLWDTLGAMIPKRLRPAALEHRLGHQGKHRYYTDFFALHNVSCVIPRGQTVGLIGRNGSGKSTLLQIIAGTLTPSGGAVLKSGRIAALLELGSGFNPDFTGRENVFLNASVLGLSRRETEAKLTDILAFADIGAFIDQPVKTYSSGMIVRLAFAVSIHVTPDILIIDEALSVGDELFQRKCFSRIEAIKEAGATILFVSHSGASVIELCDRAILLDGGEIIADGSPKRVVADYHKMLYASAEKQTEIKQALLAARSHQQNSSEEQSADGSSRTVKTATSTPPAEIEERFDEGMSPTSTLSYEPRGAFIQEPRVETLDGRRVNQLVRGRDYLFKYRVHFNQAAECVHFAMLVKTTSGLELGGGVTAHNAPASIPFVAAGTAHEITFRFSCRLNSGVYFLNCGVVGHQGDSLVYLHRIIDASTFRVMPVPDNRLTGIVDLVCDPIITPI